MNPSESEIRFRSNLFMACIAVGMGLMPLSLWLYSVLMDAASHLGLTPPDWLNSVLGLAMAFLPVTVCVQVARRHLRKRYPDSSPRRVPEAWER